MTRQNDKSSNKFKPHGHRRKVFPDAHIPLSDYINHQILVTKLNGNNKDFIYMIFQETPEHFRATNIKLGSGLQSLFKNNILFLCDLYRIGLNDLFRQINDKGIRGSYQAFLNGNGTKYFSLLYLAQFSRIFDIGPGILVGVDLRLIWINYDSSQPINYNETI
jgi:hypothetical protein